MATEQIKLGHSTDSQGEKLKHFGREVREMMASLTHKISDHGKSSSSSQYGDDDDEDGVRMVTIAGTNIGATMRGEVDGKLSDQEGPLTEQDGLSTYVNSNFQSINNSLMMGGSYNTNDPGVHLDISDFYEHPEDHHEKKHKHGKRGKKIDHDSS